jgi:Glycosyl hydrolases family 31
MRNAIPDMLTNGLSGISFVGADICGFNAHATEDLCARWIAAGALQPLCRDHHADGYQELYRCTASSFLFLWVRIGFLIGRGGCERLMGRGGELLMGMGSLMGT